MMMMTMTMMVTNIYGLFAYVATLVQSNVNKILHLNLMTTWDVYHSMHHKIEGYEGYFNMLVS